MSDRREEFTVGTEAEIDLRIASGRIAIAEAPATTITVEITGPQASEFIVEQRGDAVTVRQPRGTFRDWRNHDIAIGAPARSGLTADLASADLASDVELGAVDIKTASGQVDLRFAERGRIKSASGDVKVRSASEELTVGTASGSASFGDVVALDASTASGDVIVEEATGVARAQTASGNIRIDRATGDSIHTKTVSGNIRVTVPTGRALDVDIRSLSGTVSLPSEPGVGSAESGPDIALKARSVSGNVELLTSS